MEMRKAIFALFIAVAVSSANASYLYWQVDSSTASDLTYSGAKVFVSNDNGVNSRQYLTLGYGDYDTGAFEGVGEKITTPLYDSVVAVVDANATYANDSSYKFYIELINYNDSTFVAQTDSASAKTYEQLVDSQFVGADLSPVSMAVWHGGSYTTVPEPTSAMLVLFGLAGLALKRRTA